MSDGKVELDSAANTISQEDLKKLINLLDTIKFGSISLIIQNNKVVQIEKNEKVRLK